MKKTIIGSGIFNLDAIFMREYPAWPVMKPFSDRLICEEVGGTCGNVMSILAHLGWEAFPEASLDESPQGKKITDDLRHYGCDCRYVTNSSGGGTTILRCLHKKDAGGNHVTTFRSGSPGGSRFPQRHFLRARDEAPAFVDALKETPSVYFFDDPAPGHRYMANALRERGSLIYFEPSGGLTTTLLKAAAISDIVKVSEENWPDVGAFKDIPLLIQTRGKYGIRFSLRGGSWVDLLPVPCKEVIDTEGAGDWTTAVFLDELFEGGFDGTNELAEETVIRALEVAQRTAAKSIRYMTPKGMIRESISIN